MSLLSDYLQDIGLIQSGPSTEELSSYVPLANLLNAVGEKQSPPVACIMNLKDMGEGLPDGGLFTKDQLSDSDDSTFESSSEAASPSRGAIEVKGPSEPLDDFQESDQVKGYLRRHRTVLITNYRSFRLLSKGDEPDESPTVLDRFTLAEDEASFRKIISDSDLKQEKEERFLGFLERVMAHGAPISHPKDVARLLASYARDAKLRVSDKSLDSLSKLRGAIEETLGVTFEGSQGEDFFRSTIIQTLFYGIFSAWTLWHQNDPERDDDFDWERTAYLLHVPVLQTLFHQLMRPGELERLNLRELLDWTGDALNRVDRSAFFDRFSKGEAVQYFYEPFLEAFDPDLREDLGVWYTPSEIVEYQVSRVHSVLQEELGISSGLADSRVKILDPCCGTGAYLVETIRFLEEYHRENNGGDAVPAKIKRAVTSRVYGFELLTAPFVVSHLQIGLALSELGAPLGETGNGSHERAGVYLTNALTGWKSPDGEKEIPFSRLEEEREQADSIKQEEEIIVVFGNPPYDGYPGVAPEESEERELSDAYRESPEGVPEPDGRGLNNLYVRFFRMAEREITESSGQGVVSFISNYKWISGTSHPGMRSQYLDKFDRIWIDNLHGDRRISERNPAGDSSQTVFSIHGMSPGIKVGTAISILSRHGQSDELASVHYRDFHQADAEGRRAALLGSLSDTPLPPLSKNECGYEFGNLDLPESDSDKSEELFFKLIYENEYSEIEISPSLGYPFEPHTSADNYSEWNKITDIFENYYSGVKTSRDKFLIEIDENKLKENLKLYFDDENDDSEVEDKFPKVMHEDDDRYDPHETRERLTNRGVKEENILEYWYRPMDKRHIYWEPYDKLLDEKREEFKKQVRDESIFLTMHRNPRRSWSGPQITDGLGDLVLSDPSTSYFPIYVNPNPEGNGLNFDGEGGNKLVPNLSDFASTYVSQLESSVESLFYHTVAILHAPTYRQENKGALQQEWPRVPLPKDHDTLEESANAGRQVAKLLNIEHDIADLKNGNRDGFEALGVPEHVNPEEVLDPGSDFSVTAGWGYTISNPYRVTPNDGEIDKRKYTPEEQSSLPDQAIELWGSQTLDVYLNEKARWTNVPAQVWEYELGGYQVIKKWLSYREKDVLGRDLCLDEVEYVQYMVRRIAALLLLEPKLDANYKAAKTATEPETQVI
jgi:hypothetical protein